MSSTTTKDSVIEEDSLLEEYINSIKEIVLEFKENKRHKKRINDNV